MKFKEYPDYKCFIKPRTSSMENKKENNYNSSHSTKKDLSEENFNKYIRITVHFMRILIKVWILFQVIW